ncbi:hypothetical protein [Nonomuraea sp. SBT364]|uniref:hypothetical protein n=1 Tax=Nonomuraea sp. SBT364 TaxID=1580530 RepID=UPI0012E326F8|nr:hypothetical protein [Nonomuraea sp. SBT364]
MGKRSRKRRVYPSGVPSFGPLGPHGPGQDDPPPAAVVTAAKAVAAVAATAGCGSRAGPDRRRRP